MTPDNVPFDAESPGGARSQAARTGACSAPTEDDRPRDIRYGISVAGARLLSTRGTLNELVGSARIYPLPRVPTWMLGLINLRGHLVPVFDLASLIEPDAHGAARHRLLVIDRGERAAAVTLDGFPQALDFARARAQPRAALPEALSAHTRAAYLIDDSEWLEIDFPGLFDNLSAQLA